MKKLMLCCAVAAITATVDLSAQEIGVGARVGSVGIGVDGAVALGPRLALRAGLGLLPFEPSAEIGDIDYDLELPRTWYNLGLDLHLSGPLRLGAGVLVRPDDLALRAAPTTSVDVGGRTFTPEEIGVIEGTLASRSAAPYAILGVGRHTSLGFGLFLDAGVALMGDPDVSLVSVGGTLSDEAELQQRLATEADRFEEDSGAYLRFWPFLSLGVKLGIG